uniref:hypothetical protein n=1 Tax=Rhodococcus hoagii TaxID=43767 RepID=UPI001C92F5E3
MKDVLEELDRGMMEGGVVVEDAVGVGVVVGEAGCGGGVDVDVVVGGLKGLVGGVEGWIWRGGWVCLR